MQQLGKREEQIMQVVWRLEKAFIKEIVDEMPDDPHYNTIATMTKILVKKGFLEAEKLGSSYRFKPLISMEAYRAQDLAAIKKKYFGNSFSNLIAHFAKEEGLSEKELEDILRIIESNNSST